VRDAALSVEVEGRRVGGLRSAAEAPAVVLLHGASGNAETWRPVLPAWSELDVWAPDLPGRGASDGPALGSAAEAGGWLRAFVEAAGLERPVVVGHSFGGAIGLSAALEAGGADWMRGLVMVASSARLKVAPAILEAVATGQVPWDAAFGPGADPETVRAYATAAAKTPIEAGVADWRACDAFDVRERLSGARLPVLVVHGAQDALTPPKHQLRLAEALPSAERRELPDAGHMLPWEAPHALASIVCWGHAPIP
jgi:pimeloyl-ACP methyl ester carboxylesterase